MSDGDQAQARIDFGSGNNFQQAIVRLGNVAGRDIIINNTDPHDVTLLRDLNPYPGLESFTYADHEKYAGRATLVKAAVAHLATPGAEQAVLLVTGASGSGKSSFVQAGVLPQLSQHYRDQQITLAWDVFRPSEHPMAALTAALRRLGAAIPPGQTTTAASWRGTLGAALGPGKLPCLVIDQFEEVFGAHVDPTERAAFFEVITGLPPFAESPIHIMATMRSDFLPELFVTPLYPLSKRGIDVQAMDVAELRQAIERPTTHLLENVERLTPELAQQMGPKQWEGALLDRLSADAAQDASFLSLLQVTLQDIWRGGHLNLGAYHDLTTAIQQRAEKVWHFHDYDDKQQTPRSEAEQAAILALMLDLVDVSLDDDARRDVRRSSLLADLTANHPERDGLIEDLVAARLLSKTSVDDGGALIERVDIIHESLLRSWERLANAIKQERTTLQRRVRFRDDLAQWQSSGQLLEGVRLATALALAQKGDTATQSPEARTLIERSAAARDAERDERLRQAEAAAEAQRHLTARTRRFAAVVAALFVVSLVAGGVAVNRQQVAQQESTTRATAEAQAIEQKGVAELSAQRLQAELNISDSQRLAFEARNQPANRAEVGLLLAYEALQKDDNSNSNTALRELLARGVWNSTVVEHETDRVVTADLSPDGTRIVTASDYGAEYGTVRLWRSDGTLIATMGGHTQELLRLLFSPDGSRILTTSFDTTARLWNSDGRPIVTLKGHAAPVTGAAFSPDGKWIVTASVDGDVRLWHSDGTLVTRLTGHTAEVDRVAFSPDGSQIVTGSIAGDVRLWRLDGSLVATLTGHSDVITSVVFSPDGSQILTASLDNTARLWRRDGALVTTFVGHTAAVITARFSPDGAQLVTASDDGSARLWRLDGTLITTMTQNTTPVSSAMFSPDGTQIVTASADSTAQLWRADGTLITSLIGHTGPLIDARFSADGTQILTSGLDGSARLWRRDNPLTPILTGHDSAIFSATFSPDGSQLLTASYDKTARLWRSDGTPIVTFKGHTDRITGIAFSPDGSQILTASEDATARLWRLDGTLVAVLKGHTDVVMNAAFSPDGTQILTASEDATARLWRLDGTPVAVLKGHTDVVMSAAFSPDGTKIITVSADKTARLWRSDGSLITILTGHWIAVTSGVFSPDGKRILTASLDATAQINLVNSEDLLKVAACRVGRGLTEEEQVQFSIPHPAFVFAERQCPPTFSWRK